MLFIPFWIELSLQLLLVDNWLTYPNYTAQVDNQWLNIKNKIV